MTILGIDPGINGAIAILTDEGNLIAVHDMPSLPDGPKCRRALNAPLLACIIRDAEATRAYAELVGTRPGEGAVGAFGFGRSRGVIEGVCGALSLPVVMIAPTTWKRAASIQPGAENKDMARARVIARWPQHAALFKRKKDVDRAEACLIALAGMARKAGVETREAA